MSSLPEASPVLAVCVHPDDESFGLGAAWAAFAARGTPTAVLCLTHGTASALASEVRSYGLDNALKLHLGMHPEYNMTHV